MEEGISTDDAALNMEGSSGIQSSNKGKEKAINTAGLGARLGKEKIKGKAKEVIIAASSDHIKVDLRPLGAIGRWKARLEI